MRSQPMGIAKTTVQGSREANEYKYGGSIRSFGHLNYGRATS